ncbi:glycine cleavage system aminomethyltransferase GcvT [bacterium]|nr:glycine cleavage system aminomethyltransferase GcvT [bacterium]
MQCVSTIICEQLMKKTPLYENHINLNARMIEFGSWIMPVQYTGIIEEHTAARSAVTLFDTCHMGEILLKGDTAQETLQMLIPRDVTKFKEKKCYYSHLCNESGGVIDDIIVYKKADNDFMIVVNSETYESDFKWINAHKKQGSVVQDVSDKTGKIDIQGPKSRDLVNLFLGKKDALNNLKFFNFDFFKYKGQEIIVSRTGYTGELGFEIYSSSDKIVEIWNKLLEIGKPMGVIPAGLGARDTLRLEMGYPLMGHEFNAEISPVEGGFERVMDFSKADFIGKKAIEKKIKGKRKYSIPFIIEKGGIARSHDEVLDENNKKIGIVTSGTFSPTLKTAIGLALCDKEFKPDQEISVQIRGKIVKAISAKTPFVENTSLLIS